MTDHEVDNPTDDELVQGATIRARVLAWLRANPGRHRMVEIEEGTGIGHNSLRTVVHGLVSNGQIHAEGATTARVFWYEDAATEPRPTIETRIHAWLQQNPGEWQRTDVATGIGSADHKYVGSTMKQMADEGRIYVRQDGVRRLYSATPPPEPPQIVGDVVQRLREGRGRKRPAIGNEPVGVEILIPGHVTLVVTSRMTIVVGKTDAGLPRVTLFSVDEE